MPKLYSSSHIIKTLLKNNFIFISQRGSHAKYRSASEPICTVIVPVAKKEIPIGTFRSIVRQSGLTLDDFV